MNNLSIKSLLLALVAVSLLVACGKKGPSEAEEKAKKDSIEKARIQDSMAKAEEAEKAKKMENAIPNLAQKNGMTTLAGALKDAGLDQTLMGGNYTVFAPTEEAFKAVKGFDKLKEDKAKLEAVLKNHVLEGSKKAADFKDGDKVKTLSGKELVVKVGKDGKMTIGGIAVDKADVEASNGTVHVIGKVIQ